MTDDGEAISYRQVMRWGARAVVATVDLPAGHVVELVAHPDGRTAWLDQECKRATTAEFAAGFAFVDEVVAAWHAGVLDSRHGDFAGQLAAVRTEIEETETKLSAARKRRVKLVPLAKKWAKMPHKDIAAAAGIDERTSRKNMTKGKEIDD